MSPLEQFIKGLGDEARQTLTDWVKWHKGHGYGDDVPMEFNSAERDDGLIERLRFKLSDAEAWLAGGS